MCSGSSLAEVSIVSPLDGFSSSTGNAAFSPPETMIISHSFPPISVKIAEKIKGGKFIEMKELMPDNVANTCKYCLLYIEIPLKFNYYFEINSKINQTNYKK